MKHTHHQKHSHDDGETKKFVDPVCGMSTEDEAAFSSYEHNGTTYYFCSDHCLAKFKENPSVPSAGEGNHGDHGDKAPRTSPPDAQATA